MKWMARALMVVVGGALLLSCASEGSQRAAADGLALEAGVPGWLQRRGSEGPALARDGQLDEAASLLCSTDGAQLDRQTRHLIGLTVGQLETAVFVGRTPADAQAKAAGAAPGLLSALRATHVGLAAGTRSGEEHCLAIVGARRLIALTAPVPHQLGVDDAFPLEGKLTGEPGAAVVLYATRPGGSVSRTEIEVNNGYFSQLITPRRGAGRYTLELMVDYGGDPEVGLLWPFRVGAPSDAGPLPPTPAVLFGDAGHDDLALSHRAEALVQRLRTEQEINVLKVAPALLRVAGARAEALSGAAGLGHRRPSGRTPLDDMAAREPKFEVMRIAEVQAQAGTLKEAWLALLLSPSHRYELVHPLATHFGAVVKTGRDAAGRKIVTLEVLLARRYAPRWLGRAAAAVLSRLNEARAEAGRAPLRTERTLTQVCRRQAALMAERGAAGDGGLGEPVADLAVGLAPVTEARSSLAAVSTATSLPSTQGLLGAELNVAGVAIAPERDGPRFMLCVVAGRSPPDDGQ